MKACLLTTGMFCQRKKAKVLIIIQQNDKSTQKARDVYAVIDNKELG